MSTEWQTMKNAPRDGTLVELTWFEKGVPQEIVTMRWDPKMRNGLFPGVVGFWVSPEVSFTWNETNKDGAPTHWRHVRRVAA